MDKPRNQTAAFAALVGKPSPFSPGGTLTPVPRLGRLEHSMACTPRNAQWNPALAKKRSKVMGSLIPKVRTLAVFTVLLALLPAFSHAELTRVDIASRVDVLGGKAFGDVGPYEKLHGRAYFAVDPANPRNQIIADIGLAPRNSEGKVEFSADLFIIKPKDPSRGNGVGFFAVVNRGRFRLLSTFSDAEGADDPTEEAHFGDASLLSGGYTLVAVGWKFDVPEELIGVKAPIPTENGQPIRGWTRELFIPRETSDSYQWMSGNATRGYLPIDLNAREYRLTSREGLFAARRLIPREDWQFGKIVDGQLVSDWEFVTLKGGFTPGLTYEIAY